ncbi:hypothetical protein C8R47DRAFT_1224003 [Mycena vitilis]|nr:hypothetical protein C8R47DRAFT_1224003 [Mycena vitilis]
MSLSLTLRSLGSRRALLNTRSMHALHSPFGAMAPLTATTSTHTGPDPSSLESRARLNIIANAPLDTFNGVPLGAYPVSTPYYATVDTQAGSWAAQSGLPGLRSTLVENGARK